MLKGALHIHSTYSDGELTLAQLRKVLAAAGCRFGCVTDHADGFDAHRLSTYVEECEARSDARFRFVPGLEFSCVNRMHVLGYGVTTLIDSTDPETVIAAIHAAGGLAVIAHPKDAAFTLIERFKVLPCGLEVWNSKYDGRYAPRPGTFALLDRLKARRPDMRAYYGQDLHWKRQYRGLFTELHADRLERFAILCSLAAGEYTALKGSLRLPSSGVVPAEMMATFARTQERSRRVRRWIGQAKRRADALGMPLPAPLKSHLRRIF